MSKLDIYTGDFESINDSFNVQLKEQLEGVLPVKHIYYLGMPSDILLSTGIPNLPIELSAERLAAKAKQENHVFDLRNVINLPISIQNPIAVFNSTKGGNSKVILTELSNRKDNFVVVLNIHSKGRGRNTIEVNDIVSLYPKNHIAGIVDWINGGLMKWADKEKASAFISVQWPNYIGNGDENKSSETINKEFLSATKVVENFENPKINIDSTKINEAFNRDLQQQLAGELPHRYIYYLGMPSDILLSTGIPNLPIELSAERLAAKAKQENHSFTIENIRNLPDAINNPIAIFNSTKKDKSKVILTELTDGNNHFAAILRTRKDDKAKTTKIEVNSIRSLYPKDNIEGILDWINSKNNLLLYVDKEKALDFISTQSTNLIAGKNNIKSLSATKVVENFENPKIKERVGNYILSQSQSKELENGNSLFLKGVLDKQGQKRDVAVKKGRDGQIKLYDQRKIIKKNAQINKKNL